MIGGEYEVDLSLQRDGFVPEVDTYYYASGRAALYQILLSLSPHHKRRVWMPDWLCYSMVEATKKAEFDVRFYELDEEYKATTGALDHSGFRDGDIVLMVNYFGLQDLMPVTQKIKNAYPTAIVIEDDVQAFWSFTERENPFADYRFTSLRKSFAIPDGGLVKTKHPMPIATDKNTFATYKLDAGVMKSRRGCGGIKDEDYLRLFEQGEDAISNNFSSVMSESAMRLFAGIDFQQAKKRRIENTMIILDGLAAIGIKPLIEVSSGCVPLFVPVYLENRDVVRKSMFQHEVFCPVHWPLEGMPVKHGAEMAKHELSLIVYQRYSINDMNQQLLLLQG